MFAASGVPLSLLLGGLADIAPPWVSILSWDVVALLFCVTTVIGDVGVQYVSLATSHTHPSPPRTPHSTPAINFQPSPPRPKIPPPLPPPLPPTPTFAACLLTCYRYASMAMHTIVANAYYIAVPPLICLYAPPQLFGGLYGTIQVRALTSTLEHAYKHLLAHSLSCTRLSRV